MYSILTSGEKGFEEIKSNEEQKLLTAKEGASRFCGPRGSSNCYTARDLQTILDLLANNKDNTVPFHLLKEIGISESAILTLVEQDVLYYSHKPKEIQARNPYFLKCWTKNKI